MAIPFPPDGPQVQAALQRLPTPQLQQYAAGKPPQPTGQVTPGPMGAAATALNERGAVGAANQRQQAMQNNPQNSPTIFQQKDAEIAQARAALQQAQQKEQQLGIVGALMAKKAQDLQARESMGVAQLPMRPDMFTAMNGGIVFNGGGRVQRFNGQEGPSFIGGISPEFGGGFEDALINATFRADRKKQEQDKVQYEFLKRAAPDVAERFAEENPHVLDSTSRVPSIAGEPEPTIYAKETKKSTRATTPSTTSAAKTGVASLSNRPSFEQNLETLRPYLERSPEEDLYSRALVDTYNKIVEAVKTGKISEEDAKKIMEAKKAELATQYQEYTKGRGERMEKIRSSLEGEAPSVWSKLAAGLPTDTRGMRLGSGIASIAKGYVGKEEEYAKRKRDAAKYMAEVEELNAKADLLEKRGQTDAAERARAAAEKRAKEGAALEVTGLQAKAAGIQPLLTTATAERGRIGTAAGQLLGAELGEDREKRLAAIKEAYIRSRPEQKPELIRLAEAMGVNPKELFDARYGPKTKPVSPRDIIAVEQYVAGLPLEQLPLSDQLKLAIKNDAKSLKDPMSTASQEIQKARKKVAQKLLSSGITNADDILSGR